MAWAHGCLKSSGYSVRDKALCMNPTSSISRYKISRIFCVCLATTFQFWMGDQMIQSCSSSWLYKCCCWPNGANSDHETSHFVFSSHWTIDTVRSMVILMLSRLSFVRTNWPRSPALAVSLGGGLVGPFFSAGTARRWIWLCETRNEQRVI